MSDNTVVTENDLTSVVEVTSAGPAGPPGGALTIQDEGVDEGLLTDKINFAGSTVSVVNDTEAEIATVTVNAADPGANTNITSLGGITGGISSPDYVQFDTAAAAAGAVGRLLWNDTDGTLEFQMKGGNVTLQIGQEEVIRVTNKAGVTMTDGQAVYITGSTGNHLSVTLAQANAEATSSKTLAVVTETIANNNTGFATSSGLVRGLNTSALTEGAAIWLSPTVPGGLTSTKPVAPNHAVLIGWCVRQHASVGVIYVHIANGYELEELHNVLITAAANNQVLRYDAATGLWKNATISPTLTLTGDVSGSATFTDLGNATLTATVADNSHNHTIANVTGLQDALDSKLAAASYTAADVLTKIKTVDGAGSGLDADLLDGQSSAYYTAINDRLGYTAENAANKGVAGGYASLDGAGLVPSTQLPSYVDDVLEFANLAAFPVTGESGKIYVAVDTSKTYRWSGSTYVEISASPGSTDAVPEGSTNLYFTTARARQSVSAGTGISYNNTTGVITNSAPDQTVAITGSGTTTVTGTYPNFTVSSADQYVGTVTSVSGTGTVNGLTLTGTVTSSGSLTLGGTLSVDLSTATVTGTLPVTKGGTGTATQFTAGSVVFAGTSGVYTQDNANLFWNDTNNRLGIGTATPDYQLHLGGDSVGAITGSLALGDVAGKPSALVQGFRGGIGDFAGSLLLSTTTGPGTVTERMRIDSSGNVGIGTNAPGAKLAVASGNIRLDNNQGLEWGGGNNYIFGNETTDIVGIATNGSERARIDTAGNLGIGTTTPASKLDVNGQITVPDQLAYDYTTSVLPDVAPALNLNFVQSGVVDPRITFTRSSTATYYDGRTQALAEQNLLTYSEAFDNAAWTKLNLAVTANTTAAPDGSVSADTFTAAAGTFGHSIRQLVTVSASTPYVFSVYAKAGTNNFIQLSNTGDAQAFANFDLANGVVGTAGTKTTASIVPAGNGWYRCSAAFNSTAVLTNDHRFYITSSASAVYGEIWTTAGTETVLVWGAQLEQRSTATAYVPTTTAAITRYQPVLVTAAVNTPRLDYDPVTRAPKGLLIEEQRTNLVTYSQEFGSWTNSGATITANTLLAPDGTTTADTVARTTSTSDHIYNALSFTGDAVKAVSVWIKKGTSPAALITLLDGTASLYRLWVDVTWSGTTPSLAFTNGSLISSTNYGNGWWRLELATTSVTAANTNRLYVYPGRTGSVNGDNIYCWGAQAENATFATSYIPTVASQVTRTADVATMTGANFSQWYNQSEGTFVVEASSAVTKTSGVFSIEDGTTINRTQITLNSVAQPTLTVVKANVSQVAISQTAVTPFATFKASAAYRENDFALSSQNLAAVTDTSGEVPTAVNQAQIGARFSSDFLNGHIRSIRYYPTRLTNTVLQGITA